MENPRTGIGIMVMVGFDRLSGNCPPNENYGSRDGLSVIWSCDFFRVFHFRQEPNIWQKKRKGFNPKEAAGPFGPFRAFIIGLLLTRGVYSKGNILSNQASHILANSSILFDDCVFRETRLWSGNSRKRDNVYWSIVYAYSGIGSYMIVEFFPRLQPPDLPSSLTDTF